MKKIALILILLSTFVYANIAKITTLAGDVSIIRASETIKATKDLELLQKDLIKTTEEGRVQLLFTDNTIISVGYNSEFSIDEYVNESNKPPSVKFGLKKGIFKSITGKIGNLNPNRFKLKTKSASIGIRGTTVLAKVETESESIICTDGGVRVENENGFTDVDAGEKTSIKNGQAPSVAEFASAADIKQLEDQSGATQNESESGVNQESADNAKNSNAKTNQNSNQNNSNANSNSNVANTQSTSTTTEGYEYELGDNSNISQNVYYKTSLTNYYSQSTDKFSTKERLIVKGGTNNALSSTDGSYGDYLSWGHWGVTNDTSESKDDYSGSTYQGRSYWISGILTPASDVPRSGSATYTGTISGHVIRDASNSSLAGSNLSGTTSITANFGSNTMSGTFNVTNFANTTLSGVTMTREDYGVTFSGNLTGSNVTSGQIDGAFFGDSAQAIGGTWVIEDTSQNAADGTFAAQK